MQFSLIIWLALGLACISTFTSISGWATKATDWTLNKSDGEFCVPQITKADLTEFFIKGATKVIMQRVEKFNQGSPLATSYAEEIGKLMMKDLLAGTSNPNTLENLFTWCTMNKPRDLPTKATTVKGPTTVTGGESTKSSTTATPASSTLSEETTTMTSSKSTTASPNDKADGDSYLCLMENGALKCYKYKYDLNTDISVEDIPN